MRREGSRRERNPRGLETKERGARAAAGLTRGTRVEAYLGVEVLSSTGSVRAHAEGGAASSGFSTRARVGHAPAYEAPGAGGDGGRGHLALHVLRLERRVHPA